MEYNIYITNDCNSGCDYCSAPLERRECDLPVLPNYSNGALAGFIRNTASQYIDPEVQFFLFGGEPTLEYQLAADCVGYLKKNLPGLNFRPILHTNGLLLDRIPGALLDDLSLVIFSIKYEHIPQHQLKPGYFSNIIDNILKIKELRADLPLAARLTISEKTSLFAEVALIDRFFDFISWKLENVPALENFNLFQTTYTYETDLLFKTWLSRLEQGDLLKYVPFMAALKGLGGDGRDDNCFGCGYDRNLVFVQTNGRCFACCEGLSTGIHYLGNLERGIAFNGFKLTDFRCGDCGYRPLCLGRCGRMHREFSPARIDEYCRLNKFMYDLFLEKKDRLAAALNTHPHLREQLLGWIPDLMGSTP